MNIKSDTWRDRVVEQYGALTGLSGIIALHNHNGLSVLTDGSDLLLVLIFHSDETVDSIYHYIKDGLRIQERHMNIAALRKRAEAGEDGRIIQWILQGEILLDRDTYLEDMQTRLHEYPTWVREQKLLLEFSLFMKRYMQCKDYLSSDQILDAYSSILRAIHHWARIAIIEEGVHPEVMVWQQVKQINPGIYKLYEELTTSSETLKQRIELVLLACEFSAMSKMENCCRPIIQMLEESERALSVDEIMASPFLQEKSAGNLPLILNRLAKKSLIREVAVTETGDLSVMEIKYTK